MGAGDSVVIKTCVFDADGNLINIGEWDEQIQSIEIEPAAYDEEGNLIEDAVYEDQPTNPLPAGAYTEEREVVYDERYGWRLADQPAPVSDKDRIEALEAALLEVILQNG